MWFVNEYISSNTCDKWLYFSYIWIYFGLDHMFQPSEKVSDCLTLTSTSPLKRIRNCGLKPLLSALTVGVFVISPIRRVKLHKATFATGYHIFFRNTSDRGHYDGTAANNSPVWLGDLPCLLYIEFTIKGIIKCERVLTN